MRRVHPLLAALAGISLAAGSALAQSSIEMPATAKPAVARGVAYLRGQVPQLKDAGMAAFTALALAKAEVPLSDPAINDCLVRVGVTFAGENYAPETRGGPDIYEAAVVVLALVNIDSIGYKAQIEQAANYLIGKQTAGGGWDYSNRSQGDESMTQYAVLALWEAESAGIVIKPDVWDRAARYYLTVQSNQGSWTYHRDSPNQGETISMTAAGIGSLMICQKELIKHRKGQENINPLMVPVLVDGVAAESRYKVETPSKAIDDGIQKGIGWLSGHFQASRDPIIGQSPYYGLYGIERLAALAEMGDKKFLPAVEAIRWYPRGLEFILASQEASGAWNAQHEQVPNTCWGILFSVKATRIMIMKNEIRRLGAGQLKGGRGLPSDLNNVEIVNGQLVARPMGGAIEGMLKVLDDSRNSSFDSALSGLVSQYQTQGPKVLRPFKDRFRKSLDEKGDVAARQVAVWALGRTGDLDVAPALIKALLDEDPDVVNDARISLQVISRKLDGGYGPDKKDPIEKRQEAARKWQEWFQTVNPPDLYAPDLVLPGASKTSAP